MIITHKERSKTQISVFLVLTNGSQILLLKRQNTGHYDGFYGLPAGRVEPNETLEKALIRESKEEIDIELLHLKLVHVMHRKEYSEGGYECLDFYFMSDKYKGRIKNNEPNKCSELKWYCPRFDLFDDIIPYVKNVLTNIECGTYYSEFGW